MINDVCLKDILYAKFSYQNTCNQTQMSNLAQKANWSNYLDFYTESSCLIYDDKGKIFINFKSLNIYIINIIFFNFKMIYFIMLELLIKTICIIL